MRANRFLVATALIVMTFSSLFLSSCSSSKIATDTAGETDARYAKALASYNKENYDDAAMVLESLMFSVRGSALEDDVLYYLAQSYFNTDQYFLAIEMYTRILQLNAGSPYTPSAQFQLAKAHEKLSTHYELDHEHTIKAIQQYAQYIEQYPGRDSAVVAADIETYRELLKINPANATYQDQMALLKLESERSGSVNYAKNTIKKFRDKLARNKLSIAHQYIQLGKPKAAVIFYDEVIKRYPETIYFEAAWKGKINALVLRKKWMEAGLTLDQYLQLFPEKQEEMKGTRDKIMQNFGNS
ncbi:MAG: outer membrane protein assembly factor BamD [Chlorobiaceae bacterium]|jgi:outer membrane protein assembly factor BamD|nr:outer membrane protein assembly factor BamD [Chlorobiaceae bacterium]